MIIPPSTNTSWLGKLNACALRMASWVGTIHQLMALIISCINLCIYCEIVNHSTGSPYILFWYNTTNLRFLARNKLNCNSWHGINKIKPNNALEHAKMPDVVSLDCGTSSPRSTDSRANAPISSPLCSSA